MQQLGLTSKHSGKVVNPADKHPARAAARMPRQLNGHSGQRAAAWGWEGTYRALVGLCPLLALQTRGELLVCAVGHLLHQLQALLHLQTEEQVEPWCEGKIGLDDMTRLSMETRTSERGTSSPLLECQGQGHRGLWAHLLSR